jgi:hypothetical protein
MARFEKIGCFGLTEPLTGSGASRGLMTTAKREGDTWIINGQKKWIGNATCCDKQNGRLYWCDREGMRVMRCKLDGSKIETLVDTSQGDPRPGRDLRKWCVGIGIDVPGGKLYWTQKGPDNAGQGSVCRANIEIPKGSDCGK